MRSARQRAASRRNLAKARKVRAHDTLGYWLRKGITQAVNVPTMGQASKVNTFVSGNYRKKNPKWYRNQSRKKR